MIICDEAIERYERQVASDGWQSLSVHAFLPSEGDSSYWGTLVELLRIRMEHQFESGCSLGIAGCLQEFPELCSRPEVVSELGFEEYRLRRALGQSIERHEYQSKWKIDTDQWPPDDAPTVLKQADWQQSVHHEDHFAGQAETSPPPSQPAALDCGEVFGPFRVLAELGQGALATVYLAQQLDLSERLVVLKVCCRATAEPQKIARLQHTNIVQILSLHRVKGYQVLCMPYVGATTLADVMRARSKTSKQILTTVIDKQRAVQTLVQQSASSTANVPARLCSREDEAAAIALPEVPFEIIVCRFLKQLASGLAHAHRIGIIHCDLKPANILIGDDGQARIVDFNVSQTLNQKPISDLVGGTMPYMAPEHIASLIEGRWQAGPSSDLYSLGAIAYQLLCGRLPYRTTSGDFSAVAQAMLDQQSQSAVRKLPSTIASPDVAAIIHKLLQSKLSDRYQTADELVEDLDRHLADRPLKFARSTSFSQRATKWMKRHPRLTSNATVGTFAAFAISIAFIIAWTLLGQVRQQIAARNWTIFQQLAPEVFTVSASVHAFPETYDALPEQIELLQKRLFNGSTDYKDWWKYLDNSERNALATELRSLVKIVEQHASQVMMTPPLSALELPDVMSQWSMLADRIQPSRFQPSLPAASGGELSDSSEASPFTSMRNATLAFQAGDEAQAIAILQRTLKTHPNQAAAWVLLGHCFVRQKSMLLADQAYSRALAIQPNQWRGWYFRGLVHLEVARKTHQAQDYQIAEECFSQAMELQPKDSKPGGEVRDHAAFNRAICLEQLGRTNEAIASLRPAVNKGLWSIRGNLMLARLWARLNQPAEAQAALQAALQGKPQDAADYEELGFAIIGSDATNALAHLRKAHQLAPGNPKVLQNLCYLTMEALPDAKAASNYLDQWIAADPSAVAYASRGVFFARQGDVAKAIADAEKAVTLQPTARQWAQIASIYGMASAAEKSGLSTQYAAKSLQYLALGLQLDWRLFAEIQQDADMKGLANSAEFRRIIDTAGALQSLSGPTMPKSPANTNENPE